MTGAQATSWQYLATFAAVVLVLAGLCLGANLLIDPLWYFRGNRVTGFIASLGLTPGASDLSGMAQQALGSVGRLTYSAYRSMAESGLLRIVEDLEASAPGLRAAIVHRLGEVPVGEASVAIAVGSPHRAAAYDASRTALERLKTEIPIWKREHYTEGPPLWREEEPLTPGI